MKVALLDLNLLIALAWPTHVHHPAAHGWFARNARRGWATCPITQMGFVRVSSNPAIIREAVSPQEALAVLGRICAMKHHLFWEADLDLLRSQIIPSGLLLGHRRVTDAYLLGLAIHKGGRLATADQSITALLPADSPHRDVLEIIDPNPPDRDAG